MLSSEAIYQKIKGAPTLYDEELHCKLILKIMMNEGRLSAFCTEAFICESTFYRWVKKHELFCRCYDIGKMHAREAWEIEGYELRDMVTPPGTINHAFDHWRMIGWSRFGISKNSRIKLDLDPDGSPLEHYKQLLMQASEGAFTASEIKQLMESVNVGLNTHQVFELQKQIDQLKSDLVTMAENNNVKNSFTNKGIA
jgi:hypothetical protein